MVLGFAASVVMSCDDSDDQLTLNDLKKQEAELFPDSLMLRDSLRLNYYRDSTELASQLALENAAGQVNYTIVVVNGSSSSSFSQGRTSQVKNLDGAVVTVSQFGRRISVTTNETGIASFRGFLRGGISVAVIKDGFTSLSYIAHVRGDILTPTGSKTELANIVPIFELTGANTATLSGRAAMETALTNKVAETA